MGRQEGAIVSVVLIFGLLLGGCLEFDRQTVYVEHDQENDQLILIIDYGGFYAGHDTFSLFGKRPDGPATKEDIEKSQAQLKEAVENRTVAFFGNFPFAGSIAELREKLKSTGGGKAEEIPEQARLDMLKLLERAQIMNGGFYADAEGRVCGAQVLTLKQAAESIPLLNRIINNLIEWSELESEMESPEDKAQTRLFVAAARKGQTWVELNGHSIILSIPLTEELFKKERGRFVDNMFETLESDPASALPFLRESLANPVLVWHEDSLLKVKLGYESVPSLFITRPHVGKYKPNLQLHVANNYGLHLDANLARYLIEPEASAETEAETAARIMAPRLTKRERVRVLINRLKEEPSARLWARLRQEEVEGQELSDEAPEDGELLKLWEEWLEKQ